MSAILDMEGARLAALKAKALTGDEAALSELIAWAAKEGMRLQLEATNAGIAAARVELAAALGHAKYTAAIRAGLSLRPSRVARVSPRTPEEIQASYLDSREGDGE